MGTDLTLLPVDVMQPVVSFSHSMLGLERRRELWPEVEKVDAEHGQLVPAGFMAYVARRPDGEPGYGMLKEDAYGSPYRMVPAGVLAKIITDDHPKNRAVRAYLEALPEDHWIVLHWH